MDVAVVIGTYGEESWRELAESRAGPSAERAGASEVLYRHEETLAQARNAGLRDSKTEYTIFLDADDELEPGYVEAMCRGDADLRAPRVRYLSPQGTQTRPAFPKVWSHTHQCKGDCLRYGNWLVIGTMVRTDLLRSVGGFEEWVWSEDWAAWARCWKAGGTVQTAPGAIYRAHSRVNSRNIAIPHSERVDCHHQIEAAIWG